MTGKVVKFPGKGKAVEQPTQERWKDAVACLQEAIKDIKSGKLNPDWVFLSMAQGMNETMKGGDAPTHITFQSMGMNTMELVGFLTMHINALLRGEFS